jgi:YbgC/YbaW family acyl-CoA thioester hydrolase
MFEYQTRVRMRNTDATGHLFFSEQFNLALEAFEEFLSFIDVKEQMPIVHAEADYKKPLKLRDQLKIQLGIKRIGKTSFTVLYLLYDLKTQEEVGRVVTVHVCTDLMTKKPIALPLKLREHLEEHSLNIALKEK